MTDTVPDWYRPSITAWDQELDAIEDEVGFTPWAETGWLAWNGMSPELEVVNFFVQLVRMMKPQLVLETGVGQGYMTRSIVIRLKPGQRLIAYESGCDWREAMKNLPFWAQHQDIALLSGRKTPSAHEISEADLCFLDSDFVFRLPEIELWHQHAKAGAVALIHDTGERHAAVTMHVTVKELILDLGMTGFFMHNPRGCFLAVKP